MNEDSLKVEIKYLNEKVDLYHNAVMGIVQPMKKELDITSRDVVTLKRDRYWLFILGFTAFGGAVTALFDKVLK